MTKKKRAQSPVATPEVDSDEEDHKKKKKSKGNPETGRQVRRFETACNTQS